MDHIDLYQCHVLDPATPADETMSTLDDFVRFAKVRYVGCFEFTVAQLYRARSAAHEIGGTGFGSLQPHYSLRARVIEAEDPAAWEQLGLGVITYGPLTNGLLTGCYRKGDTPAPGTPMHQ